MLDFFLYKQLNLRTNVPKVLENLDTVCEGSVIYLFFLNLEKSWKFL